MKVLLVSDLHYRLRQLDWVINRARAVDVVALAGDLLDISSPAPLEAQIAAVSRVVKQLGSQTQVLVASGNHDLDGRDENGEKSARWVPRLRESHVGVDGDSVLVDGTLFTVCPWWDGPLGRAQLGAQLAAAALIPKQRWVWVHHATPKGSPLSWNGRKDFGDDALAGWIADYSPDVVLSGHIHQAPFVDGGGWAQRIGGTWVFNPGQEFGPVPPHILIDLDAGTARWTSIEDSAEQSLLAKR